jgi:hypothetical protein
MTIENVEPLRVQLLKVDTEPLRLQFGGEGSDLKYKQFFDIYSNQSKSVYLEIG